VFEIVEENVRGAFKEAEEGVTAEAVRSGLRAVTVTLVHGLQLFVSFDSAIIEPLSAQT
jgi:hypothetical protein